jgi:hypothetical protein
MDDALSERLRSAEAFVQRAKDLRRLSLNAFVIGKTGTVIGFRDIPQLAVIRTNQKHADLLYWRVLHLMLSPIYLYDSR